MISKPFDPIIAILQHTNTLQKDGIRSTAFPRELVMQTDCTKARSFRSYSGTVLKEFKAFTVTYMLKHAIDFSENNTCFVFLKKSQNLSQTTRR